MALNAWMVSGRLTRAPWVADSDKVLKLTIASNKGYSQEAIKKAQEQGNTLKTADFYEMTIFKNSKGRDNTKVFNLAKTLKKGDFVTLNVRPENTEPQKRTNKDGIPEIYHKDLYVVTRIEDIVRYNNETIEVGTEDNEPDPIEVQAKMSTPAQQNGGGNTQPPSDW